MINPKVSVIIPSYNHAKYLRRRIESILNQSFQDFEILILDDNSSDNSKEIIESYRTHSKVFKIIYNEINSGSTFKQWNKGLLESNGDYIWIAESDDYAETNLLEVLVSKLDKNINVGLAYCQSIRIDENDDVINSSKNSFARWENEFINSGKKELIDFFILNNTIPNASAVIFRKGIANLVNKQYVNYKFCGDRFFWSNVLINSDVAYSPLKLNYFRDHSQNVSRKYNKAGLLYIESLQVLKFLKKEMGFSNKEYNKIKYHWSDKLLTDVLNSSIKYKTLFKILLTSSSKSFFLFFYFIRSGCSYLLKNIRTVNI